MHSCSTLKEALSRRSRLAGIDVGFCMSSQADDENSERRALVIYDIAGGDALDREMSVDENVSLQHVIQKALILRSEFWALDRNARYSEPYGVVCLSCIRYRHRQHTI